MPLTTAQLTTLKAAILAETNPAFVDARTKGQTPVMREWLDAPLSPAINCWRSSVPAQDADECTPWVAFDTLSAGKRESWNVAFMRYPRDFTRAPVRKWVTDIWGVAAVGSSAEAIFTGCAMRAITRAEGILGGSNTASINTVSARKLSWEGPLTDQDIGAALEG